MKFDLTFIMCVAAIVQIALIIAIFAIASNISKIRKSLHTPSGTSYYEQARMDQLFEDNASAVVNYKKALYRFEQGDKYYNKNGDNKTKHVIGDIKLQLQTLQ